MTNLTTIVKEMKDKGIDETPLEDIFDYLYNELQRERKINNEYYECFVENTTPNDVLELITEYRRALALITKHHDAIVKENRRLKTQTRYRHELNKYLLRALSLSKGEKVDE